MRCSEAIKEMKEWNSAFDCRKMSNCSQIHNFLNGVRTEHCETCLTTCHNVRVIAEDAQSVGSNGTSRYVNNARQQLTSDLVHIGDHQQQTLGSCISSC